jgi:hypothetical protein
MNIKIYFDFKDWWIGYYRGSNYHFICPLPTIVIRWERKKFKKFRIAIDPGKNYTGIASYDIKTGRFPGQQGS